ncbi:MAG: hypothetical protein ACFE9Z_12845, partial [Promethearchaeota archaeon]
ELLNTNKNIHYTINRDKLYSLGESIKANAEKEFSHVDRFGQIFFELYFEEEKEEYNLAIYCENLNISKSYNRQGPPIEEIKHAEKFKKKNPSFYEKNGYLWVETPREFSNFFEFLNNFIKIRIPENFSIINCSDSFQAKTSTGKKTIYILKSIILPFYL